MKPSLIVHRTLLFVITLTAGAFCACAFSADQLITPWDGAELKIWPGHAPGSENATAKLQIIERSKDPQRPDRIAVHTLKPFIKVFKPEKANGTAVVVAPGGAYQRVVVDKEGPDTAAWLNSLGVTVFVLYYRLPEDDHINAADVPLQDAQRAIRYVRANAKRWKLDPARVGYAGYSAGGHLGASLAAFHNHKTYTAVDKIDQFSPKPDFVILGYPAAGDFSGEQASDTKALKGRDGLLWKYRIEAPITALPPPTFIFHAEDDPAVSPEHAHRITKALRKAGGSVELHIFRGGGHGFGIRDAKGPVAIWPELCEAWLRSLGELND